MASAALGVLCFTWQHWIFSLISILLLFCISSPVYMPRWAAVIYISLHEENGSLDSFKAYLAHSRALPPPCKRPGSWWESCRLHTWSTEHGRSSSGHAWFPDKARRSSNDAGISKQTNINSHPRPRVYSDALNHAAAAALTPVIFFLHLAQFGAYRLS